MVVYEHAGGGCSSRAGASSTSPTTRRCPACAPCWTAGAEIVRYHPHLRCTVRLGERYGKVLADDSGPALLAAQRELWAHRDELGFAVAEPLEYDAATRTVWLGAVRGEPVEPTPELARRMGAALATLARSGVCRRAARAGGEARGGEARTARPRRARGARATSPRRSSRPSPSLRGEVEALLARIAALHAAAADVPLRPTHGAPHPTAWLLDGERLGLVDFDRLALGHPERDVAAFAGRRARRRRRVRARLRRARRDPARGLSPRARAREGAARDLRPQRGRARAGGAAAAKSRRAPVTATACVVDSVNVSVLLYVPVRSASLALIRWLKPSVTASLETGPL